MKTGTRALMALVLSFVCTLTCVGYANLTGIMTVVGTADAKPPYDIYITSVVSVPDNTGGSATVNHFVDTIVNLSVRLDAHADSTHTLRVTVYNNTDDYYTFKGVLYDVGDHTYDNTNIVFYTAGMKVGDKVHPHTSAYVDITFAYDSYRGYAEDLDAVLDVHFGLSGAGEGTDYESYISAFLSNSKGYGLNNADQKGDEVFNNLKNHGLLYAEDNLKGGNLKHLVEAVNSSYTSELTFVYRYVSDTEVILYTYEEVYNSSSYNEQSITVYRITFLREISGSGYSEWKALDHLTGTATIESLRTPAGTSLYAINIDSWTIKHRTPDPTPDVNP